MKIKSIKKILEWGSLFIVQVKYDQIAIIPIKDSFTFNLKNQDFYIYNELMCIIYIYSTHTYMCVCVTNQTDMYKVAVGYVHNNKSSKYINPTMI